MPTISIHVDDATLAKVSHLAEVMDRSKSWVVADALKPYIQHREWMVAETAKTLDDIKNGRAVLVDHDAVMAEITAYAKSLEV